MIRRKGIIALMGVLCSFSLYGQNVALKTNVVADATSTINLAAEIGIKPKTTLDIYANYNPWSLGGNKQTSICFCNRNTGSGSANVSTGLSGAFTRMRESLMWEA